MGVYVRNTGAGTKTVVSVAFGLLFVLQLDIRFCGKIRSGIAPPSGVHVGCAELLMTPNQLVNILLKTPRGDCTCIEEA